MIGSDEDSFRQEIRQEAKEMAKPMCIRDRMIGVDNIITDRPILAREVIRVEENAENLLARLRALLR